MSQRKKESGGRGHLHKNRSWELHCRTRLGNPQRRTGRGMRTSREKNKGNDNGLDAGYV
jgi:hypothetical protein